MGGIIIGFGTLRIAETREIFHTMFWHLYEIHGMVMYQISSAMYKLGNPFVCVCEINLFFVFLNERHWLGT